jgi:CRISPR/Cas system-associated exonuclease Cas4 (RecB family)
MSGKGRDRKDVPEDEVPVPGGMPKLIVAGTPINGYIDVLDLSANKPVVLDHKTTSSLDWAKTKEELIEDVQMTIYGSYALDVCASMGVDANVVEVGHIVYLTKGAPYAQRTTVDLTREHLASERKKLAETIEEMKEAAKEKTPAAVPGEASVCNKYGGCHFKDKCQALGMLSNVSTSPFASFSTPTKNPTTPNPVPSKESDPVSTVDPLAALAALRAKKAAAAAANPEAVTAAPVPTPAVAAVENPVTAPAPASAAMSATLAKYGITRTANAPVEPAQSIVPSDVPPQSKTFFGQTATSAPVAAPAVVEVEEKSEEKSVRKPKGFLAKLTALEWTPQQIERMNAEAMRAAIDGSLNGKAYSVRPDGSIYVPGVGALDTATIPATEMPFESEEDEAKFLKVFPEEAENVAAAKARAAATVAPSESVHPSQQVAAPGIPAKTVAAPVAAPVAPVAAPSLVVYIDCAPEKGRERDYVLLEDYIQPMLPLVVEAYNRGCKKDDEKVPFYSLIPYARGPGFVAALVMQQPPTGVIVANTRFPATNAILEVLIPMADVVVRGTR